MKIDDLGIAEKSTVCAACEAFVAECLTPVGEGSAPMCWLCAHHVVEHNCPVREAATAECECTPDEVYPVSVLKARQQVVPIVTEAMLGRTRLNDLQRRYAKHIPFIQRTTRLKRS